MSSPLKSLALSGLAVFALVLPAFAQTTTIEGTIKDADGKPVQNAVVNIDRTDIKGHYQLKTDKKGHYGHYGLPMGVYNVSVTIDGKVRDNVNGFRTKFGDPSTRNFYLKASAEQQQALQKAAETGTLTADQERGMTKE